MPPRWPALLGCLALGLTACRKADDAPAAGTPSPGGAGRAAAARPPADAPAAAPGQTDLTAQLAELTQALRRFGFEQKRLPTDLNELVTATYAAGLPEPPPGMKLAIDAKKVQVVLLKR